MCEVDSDMVEVAEKWFGFERSCISVHIEDGVKFIKKRGKTADNEEGLTHTNCRGSKITSLSLIFDPQNYSRQLF